MLALFGDEKDVATQQIELGAVVGHHAQVVRDDLQVAAQAAMWHIMVGVAHLAAEAVALPGPR